MGLSQYFRSLDLAVYPQVALVLFLGVFIAATLRAWSRAQERSQRDAAMLPLDDAPLRSDGRAA